MDKNLVMLNDILVVLVIMILVMMGIKDAYIVSDGIFSRKMAFKSTLNIGFNVLMVCVKFIVIFFSDIFVSVFLSMCIIFSVVIGFSIDVFTSGFVLVFSF